MNCKLNDKIKQVEETSLVIGIDIGSTTHYARAFDWRKMELAKIFRFSNTLEGYEALSRWMENIQALRHKEKVIVGIEPTGHYWFTLGQYLQGKGIKLVMVNPYAVKQSKELDDNNQTKNDAKDPSVIAKLVIDGRYSIPYVPSGAYADLRIMFSNRTRISREIVAIKNHLARWFAIHFPEYKEVFRNYEAQSSLHLLKVAATPSSIVALGANGINKIWRDAKIRAVGMKRATTLYETAKKSIGQNQGTAAAEVEMKLLLEDYEAKMRQYASIMAALEEAVRRIPGTERLLAIKGIGLVTVAGFLAETGDLGRFESPKQIQKLAGLSLKENSSGQHKGETTISRRGRHGLRNVLFNAVIPLLATNDEFRSMHEYYTTRTANPLRKKQSAIALCGKLIRIFYVVLVKGTVYDGQKMLADIHRNGTQVA
ncbi:MAG: IS110 family transposase [Clostridia bacterium]|nr:IS110 family transposase [Clostridia bacterium]